MLVRAAAKQGLDFREAKLSDRWWWLKVRWITDELDKESERLLLHTNHAQHIAAFDYSAGDKSYKHHWEAATRAVSHLYNSCYPWDPMKVPEPRDAAKAMSKEWVQRFGDPNDPEVAKRINRVAKAQLERFKKATKNQKRR